MNAITRVPRQIQAALLVALIATLAVAGWFTCSQRGDDGGGTGEQAEAPVEHQPTADGWAAIDVAPSDKTYRLTPKDQTDAGVARDTAFVLESSANDLDRDHLSDLLVVDPPLEFDVSGSGNKRLTIQPKEPLREGTDYHFTLLSATDRRQLHSWAFQTEAPLRVVQTLPADHALNVPLDTGIEMTFSHDGVSGFEDHVTIDPPVPGRFELHKRVVVLVPKELAPETVYTVTVAAGVRADGADLRTNEPYMFSFETGSSARQDAISPIVEGVFFDRLLSESSTSDPPALQVDVPSNGDVKSLPLEVYRYKDVAAFIDAIAAAVAVPRWSYYGRRDFRLDPSGLDRVATFTSDVTTPSSLNPYVRYVTFPSALDPGFYLVQAASGDRPAQALLQVTDLAAYGSLSATKTLVWVNDLTTGGPVDGAKVVDDGGKTFETNADGVALFDTTDSLLPTNGQDGKPRVLRVEQGGRTAVVPFDTANAGIGYYGSGYGYGGGALVYDGSGTTKYWSYLYADRSLYHPSDEINFWGVARARENFQAGETLTVRLSGGSYFDTSYRPSQLAETSVRVSGLGTFEGALSFEGVAPGGYQLTVLSGDSTLASTYVQVQNFVKPAYEIDITADRQVVFPGDTVAIDVATRFFDGSPVPFVALTYGGPDGATQIPVTTDADGAVTLPYVAGAVDPYGGPGYRYASAFPTGPEQGEISGQSTFYVLPSALLLQASGNVENGEAQISGSVHAADPAGFVARGYEGLTGDAAPGRAVTANVTEITYNQVETGEYYDFIAKVTRKQYRYDPVERALGAFTATSGADGSFTLSFPVERKKSYRIQIGAVDDAGRLGGTYVYVSGDEVPYTQYPGDTNLIISETAVTPQGPYSYAQTTYDEGDPVDLTIRRGGQAVETDAEQRYLFVRARDGIRDYVASADPRLQWTYSADDVPDVTVGGVQFNGHGYEPIRGEYVAGFNADTRKLNVDVTPDRDRYQPGDDVSLSVETRDADGNPVSAEVLLSLVDQAIVALQGEDYRQDILGRLYSSIGSGVLATYVPSYTDVAQLLTRYANNVPVPNTGGDVVGPNTGPGTAAGGIAAPAPRSDFRDLALFQAVRTRADGTASVTFKLPDNITSWRVTSRAVTGDLRAGAGTTAIPVGLPFFVEVTASDEYLTADHPTISLRAFGRSLTQGDAIEYTVSAPSLGLSDTVVNGAAFRGVDFTLPPLTEGEHEITVTARSGDLADAIVRKISVVASRLSRGEARYYTLESGVTLAGATSGRTQVAFTDNNRGRYYDDLLRLGWTYGDRVDQILARSLAQQLLEDYFSAPSADAPAFDASLYQTEDGGIALFPYADADLLLSARVASVAPDTFGRNALAQYFRKVLDDPDETRERSIVALFGLAAVGEPVLDSIDGVAGAADLSPRERLYLGLAALAAGDETVAREQYRQVVLRYAERRDPYVRVRAGVDQDDILELTALAADLGAGIGDPAAAPMFEYTQANATTDLLVELEQISYLSRAVPRLSSAPVRFSYVVDGQRKEQTLEAGRSFSLSLSPEQLAQLDPKTIDGNVGVATYFQTPFDPATVSVDPDVTVRRVVDVDGGGISEGDVVEVRLDYTLAPQSLDGCYQITDIAPSGLRPITRPRRYDPSFETLYPYLIDGQRVSFCAYRNQPYHPAAYFARVVTKGEYVADPATIQSQQSADSFNFAPPTKVIVR